MPRRPKVTSSLSSENGTSISFRGQIDFDATQSLLRSRSDCFLQSKRKQDKEKARRIQDESTAWDIKPPDFRLQLYQPKPTTRNARESMLPDYNEDEWRAQIAAKRKDPIKYERIPLPRILQEPKRELEPFVTHFDIPDSYAANKMFVKNGKFPSGKYTNPEQHVFRPDTFTALVKKYGVLDFKTAYTRDPQGLIAKGNGLRVLCEAYKDLESSKIDGYRKQMITYRPQDKDWDVSLILPTRAYRKGRSPQSALMKRIEQQLPWCPHRDKLDPIHRPDIHDNKTVDWIAVTGHSKDESTRI